MYSLWWLPSLAQRPTWQGLVDELSDQGGGPRFEPHVTIQGDLDADEETVVGWAYRLARGERVVTRVSSVRAGATRFQALFVVLDDPGALAAQRIEASALSGTRVGLSDFAHLSLAYLDPLDPFPAGVAPDLERRLAGHELTLDTVAVAWSSKFDPVESWRVIAEFRRR